MSSKFKGILERVKEREVEQEVEPADIPPPAPLAAPALKKRGRPVGKRSDADCTQITAYIQKDTHRDVKISLLKSGSKQDFSDLIESLLSHWLKSHT